jgi:hypothetical protein
MKHLELEIPIAATVEEVFRGFTDWAAQGEWMVGTDVRPVLGDGRGVGGRLEAWSGVGRLGFLDTMVITEWVEPERVVVLHTGKVVRGDGIMAVRPDDLGTGAIFTWAERIIPPLGPLGELGWPLVRPAFGAGVKRSLEVFARLVEEGRWRS